MRLHGGNRGPWALANLVREVIPVGSSARLLCLAALAVFAVAAGAQSTDSRPDLSETVQAFGSWDWPVYLGDQTRGQYSPLAQINATNVHRLRPAWEYRAGDATERSTMYSNPLVVDGILYAVTPSLNAVAVDATTGERIWLFDPSVHNNGTVIRQRNRGVTYWKGDAGERIFHFVRDRAYAIDARSGELIRSFGSRGYIDLRENLGVNPEGVALQMTTPGAVYKNLLIPRVPGERVLRFLARTDSGVRCGDRKARVGFPHDPAPRRVRARHMVLAGGGNVRRRQCLGRRHD